MEHVSTWSEDCARGLMHPDSVASRKARIAQDQAEERNRCVAMNAALDLLRHNVKKDEDVVDVLHALGAALAKLHGPTSYRHPVITAIDELACKLEEA